MNIPGEISIPVDESANGTEDTKIYEREELLARLQAEAEAALSVKQLNKSCPEKSGLLLNRKENLSSSAPSSHVVVGFVGYPNVGKSSTINALAGEKRAGVTSTPGKTKHFQTLIISERLMLCDCPGLVFPSFSSSRYDMVASGVLPIDRMTEHREAVQVVANQVPRHILESVYKIDLPRPKQHESPNKPPSAQELLRAYCSSRGHVISSGLPDETRAARQILKDYVDGKLPHFKVPPGMVDGNDNLQFSCVFSSSKFSENIRESENGISGDLPSTDGSDYNDHSNEYVEELVLDELRSFEASIGGSYAVSAPPKKKATNDSHKQHKKPQRKKDRSWRVGNDGSDGTPVARVFQKPPMRAPV